ncbi:unnamed protein product [Porites evermanni]|uniref:G-protein coupled receptors family 1 profile domain-containing protein n=1 Tax=Porites evermanni TaxID=104178 RepID=A0ABN8QP56_9CNID|nr:unnamed protein product [Porites evermanni]
MNFLLLNLAVADMMVALFITPRFILSHFFTHPDGKTGTLFCKLLTGGNFTWTGGAASVFTLVAIAFERYYAVMYPYGNKGKLTSNKLMGIRIPLPPAASGTLRKKTLTPFHPTQYQLRHDSFTNIHMHATFGNFSPLIIIPTSWTSAAILNVPLFLTIYFDKEVNFCMEYWPNDWLPKAYSSTWFFVAGIILVTLMTALYSRVVYSLWFKQRENNSENTNQGVMKVRKRVTKMVLAVSVIYGLCWMPNLTIYALNYFSPTQNYGDVTYITSIVLVSCNSTVNPFIYVFVNQKFRRKIKTLLGCKITCVLMTPMNFLLVNLALADIMVALFIAPQFILIHTFKHPDGLAGTLLCKFLTGGNLMWTGATASSFSLVVIAFERYFAVMYPYGNRRKLTTGKLKKYTTYSPGNIKRYRWALIRINTVF